MSGLVHRNNALQEKILASNILMGTGNDKTDTVEKRIEDLENGGSGGSTVEVTPLLDEGVHIADIEVDGVKSELYAPEGGGTGNVNDVLVDGVSVVNQDGEAEIDLSDKQDKLVASTNIQIGQDGKTISATDTTYSDFVGATSQQAGSHGLVPAPLVTEKDKFLKGDGTWGEAGGGNVDDVVMNGQSIVDANKVASFNNYVELTRAEWEALPNTKYSDGILYCIKDSGSEKAEFFSPIIYSLAEREVGVWTDGKPLYEKTIHTGALSAGDNTTAHNVSNIDVIVDLFGFARQDNLFFPLPFVQTNNLLAYAIKLYANLTSVYCVLTNENYISDSYVIIQYTKTTDNPGTGKWTQDGIPAIHYSTDEKVIGTWIDGKTLYEKTYVYPVVSAISSTTTLFTIPGIRVKKIDAYGIGYNEGAVYPIPWNGEGWETGIKFVGEQLILNVSGTSWDNNYSFVITLQYTKSTD